MRVHANLPTQPPCTSRCASSPARTTPSTHPPLSSVLGAREAWRVHCARSSRSRKYEKKQKRMLPAAFAATPLAAHRPGHKRLPPLNHRRGKKVGGKKRGEKKRHPGLTPVAGSRVHWIKPPSLVTDLNFQNLGTHNFYTATNRTL